MKEDSYKGEKKGLGKSDIIDAGMATLCLLALLWLQGWFPFNGYLDGLTGKDKPAQAVQASAATEQGAPAQRKIAPPVSFEEVAKACVVVYSVIDKKPPCGSGVFVGVGSEYVLPLPLRSR